MVQVEVSFPFSIIFLAFFFFGFFFVFLEVERPNVKLFAIRYEDKSEIFEKETCTVRGMCEKKVGGKNQESPAA